MKKFEKQEVYDLLKQLPRGRVITYGELARRLGNEKWARCVGNVLHDNPDGEKCPCYKVVNSRGEVSEAYAFGGAQAQIRRLENEGIPVKNGRVDLKKYGV